MSKANRGGTQQSVGVYQRPSIIRLPNVSMEREAGLVGGTGLRGNELEVAGAGAGAANMVEQA